uniref:MutS homolog 5 n=1 Tax=Stegastes partitus TaxID=144197 RepID=A0A3B5B9S0_9TELE
MAAALENHSGGGGGGGGGGLVFGAPGLNGDEEEEEDSPAVSSNVLLSVLVQHGQLGLCFYDSADSSLHYMTDTPDNHELHLLARVIQEVSPHVLITSAKQERCMTRYLQQLERLPENDFPQSCSNFAGLEVGKQRLLSANLPFLPACISDRDRISYLSSCISFDSPLMVRKAVGALLKCLDRRRVGVELEDSSVGVPILKGVVCIDRDTYSVLQIFKSELHPSVYKLHSGEKEGLSLYGILNRCRCKFGSKLLRRWFLRPTQDLAVLHRRQEVICFFTSPRNSDVLTTLQSSLRNIRNIPTLLRRMSLSNTKVTDWQSVYKTVYSAVCIRDTVRHLPQSVQLFHDISEGFSDDLQYIASLISRVVDFETSLAENRFTVKPNVDPTIDEKKRKMMGLSDFLTDVARKELEHLDAQIPSCCVIYIPLIGFLLSVPRLPSMVEKEDFEIEGLDFMFLSEDRLHYRSQRTRELDDLLGDLHCDIRGHYTDMVPDVFAIRNCDFQDTVLFLRHGDGRDDTVAERNSRENLRLEINSSFVVAQKHSQQCSVPLQVDGLSLLAASISHWLRKAPVDVPHVLLATNFHSVLQLGLLPSSSLLSLLTLETAVDGDELVFLYQLKAGICQSSYAANIATLAGLPSCLVQRGVEVSELYRTGRPIKRTDKASSDECSTVVEKFLSLNLDDKDLDLQGFMKDELLPSAGELLNRS